MNCENSESVAGRRAFLQGYMHVSIAFFAFIGRIGARCWFVAGVRGGFLRGFSLRNGMTLIANTSCNVNFNVTATCTRYNTAVIFGSVGRRLMSGNVTTCGRLNVRTRNCIYSIAGRRTIGTVITRVRGRINIVSVLIGGTNVVGHVPVRRVSTTRFHRIVSISLGTPFVMSGTIVPNVLGGNRNGVVGVYSVVSRLNHRAISTCTTTGNKLGVLAHGVYSRCNRCGVRYGNVNPNCVTAPRATPLHRHRPSNDHRPFSDFVISGAPTTH